MKKFTRMLITLLILMTLLTSCRVLPDERVAAPDTGDEPQIPGETAAGEMIASELSIPEMLGHESGHFSLEIRLNLEQEQVCTAEYPFSIRMEGDRVLLTGASDVVLACEFSGRACADSCSKMNLILDFNTRIDGEVIIGASGSDQPNLELYYFYDGMLREFYSEPEDDLVLPYTQDSPLEMTSGDFLPALMPFEAGAEAILLGEENKPVPANLPIELAHTFWMLKLFLD